MAGYQYLIEINDARSVRKEYPKDWGAIVQTAIERGWIATLKRRSVYSDPDPLWVNGLRDFETGELPQGWIFSSNRAVSSWQVLADTTDRSALLTGGESS